MYVGTYFGTVQIMNHLKTIPTFGCANFIPVDYTITRVDRAGRGGSNNKNPVVRESELIPIQYYVQVRASQTFLACRRLFFFLPRTAPSITHYQQHQPEVYQLFFIFHFLFFLQHMLDSQVVAEALSSSAASLNLHVECGWFWSGTSS